MTTPPTRRRWLAPSVAAGMAAALVGLVVARDGRPSRAQATTPAPAAAPAGDDDTVPFDHTIHVGDYGMACLACHVDASRSTTAGLPSLRRCMGCHKFVAKDRPAIQHLAALWEAGRAPRWPRVYSLPDFVYFTHRVHVAAEVDCARCHGRVGEMHRVTRQQALTMGWCLGCHRERRVEVDCVGCHK